MKKMLLLGGFLFAVQNVLYAGEAKEGGKAEEWSLVLRREEKGQFPDMTASVMLVTADEESPFAKGDKTKKCRHGFRDVKLTLGPEEYDSAGEAADLDDVFVVPTEEEKRAGRVFLKYWRARQARKALESSVKSDILLERSGDSTLFQDDEALQREVNQRMKASQQLRRRRSSSVRPERMERASDADDEATGDEQELRRNGSSTLELCALGFGYLGQAVKEVATETAKDLVGDVTALATGFKDLGKFVLEGAQQLGEDIASAFEEDSLNVAPVDTVSPTDP